MEWFLSVYVLPAILVALTVYYFRRQQRRNKPILTDRYDYIVIGAGSAGCVLAARLSEDKDKTVLLLEAGPSDNANWKINIPGASLDLRASNVDWNFTIEPQEHACKAWIPDKVRWPRGKCLGGSSSINGMMYVRGDSSDYDNWEKLGAEGWAWKDVLPYFLKSENNIIPEHVGSPYHGKGGPLTVSDQTYHSQLSMDFIKAGVELGYDEVDASTGENIIGFCKVPATIENNSRCSAARAFLKPAMERSNLTVTVGAHVCKIAVEDKRAIGVHFILDKKMRYIGAKNEVIVSAGAVCSPQILMLSGIGPRTHLEDVGIECVQDLPVGENLQDHYAVMAKAVVDREEDVVVVEKAMKLSNLINYLLGRKSLLASNGVEASCFVRTGLDKETEWPDLQLHFAPCYNLGGGGERALFAIDMDINPELGRIVGHDKSDKELFSQPGCIFIPTLLHPKSRGSIQLRDSNPTSHPVIDPKYLEDEYDVKVMVEGMKLAKRLCDTSAMKEKGTTFLNLKMPGVTDDEFSDENLAVYSRHFGGTIYHPCGTCKMGSADDITAVVDPQLRVRGMSGLRVADASIMPHVISGNINAPCIMIGEKAADLIKMESTT